MKASQVNEMTVRTRPKSSASCGRDVVRRQGAPLGADHEQVDVAVDVVVDGVGGTGGERATDERGHHQPGEVQRVEAIDEAPGQHHGRHGRDQQQLDDARLGEGDVGAHLGLDAVTAVRECGAGRAWYRGRCRLGLVRDGLRCIGTRQVRARGRRTSCTARPRPSGPRWRRPGPGACETAQAASVDQIWKAPTTTCTTYSAAAVPTRPKSRLAVTERT